MLKLRLKDFGKGTRIIMTENWLTNGIWAIRKDQVEGLGVLEAEIQAVSNIRDIVTRGDGTITLIIPKDVTPFVPTPILLSIRTGKKLNLVRVYKGEKAYLGIDETYVKLLGLEENILYGNPNGKGAFIDTQVPTEASKMVCPVRLKDEVLRDLAPITDEKWCITV